MEQTEEKLHPSIVWARTMLAQTNVLILDTETTGLGETDEIIDIALIDLQGNVKLDTLIACQGNIPMSLTALHGITNAMLEGAPFFPTVWHALALLLAQHEIIIYNSEYDMRMLRQMAQRYVLPFSPESVRTHCLLRRYSAYIDEYSDYFAEGYRYQSLAHACRYFSIKQPHAHRALADVLTSLEVLRKLAAATE